MNNKCIFFIFFALFPVLIISQDTSKQKENKLTEEQYEEITKKIKYLNSSERILTIKNLEKLSLEDKKKFYDLLIDISQNETDPTVREAALKFLAEEKVNTNAAVESYKKNIFFDNEKVQIQALKAIEYLELKDLQNEFLELIKKTDFTQNGIFVNALIRTLGILEYNQKEISELLIEKFKDVNTHLEIKRTILLYAGNSKNYEFKSILLEIIEKEEDIYLKSYAINSLGKIYLNANKEEKEEIIQKCKKQYEDILSINDPKERAKYNPLKQHLILTLVRLGDSSVKEEIKKLAMDDDANVRLKALDFIEDLELKEFVDLVYVKYKYDPSKSVKNKAKQLLEKWGILKKE